MFRGLSVHHRTVLQNEAASAHSQDCKTPTPVKSDQFTSRNKEGRDRYAHLFYKSFMSIYSFYTHVILLAPIYCIICPHGGEIRENKVEAENWKD